VRALALLAAVLCACTGTVQPQPRCTQGSGFMGQPAGEGFGHVGQTLDLELRLAVVCPATTEVRATVSVLGPDNLPLPIVGEDATRVIPESARTGEGVSTRVKVLATAPGPYHFTARFEPNLGTAQRDVIVAESFLDAGPSYVLPATSPLASCSQIDVTPLGKLLCLSSLSVYEPDGGGLIQTFADGQRAAHVNGTVWVAGPSRVTRYVEQPAWFADGGAWLNSNNSTAPVAADETGAFVANDFNNLFGVFVTDAGFVTGQHPLGNGAGGALWKRGDAFITAGPTGPICFGRFQDAGSCDFSRNLSGLAGSEPAGVWSVSNDNFPPNGLTLNLHTGAVFRELVLPPGWTPSTSSSVPWDTAVTLVKGSERLFVVDRGGNFTLQKYPPLSFLSATSRWVALKDASGRVLLFRR